MFTLVFMHAHAIFFFPIVHTAKNRKKPQNKNARSYGWDNEYGSREFSVPSFEAGKHMVSNGEYLEFVKDAGYARQELWTDVGWRWKMFGNVKKPHFWTSGVGFGKYCL